MGLDSYAYVSTANNGDFKNASSFYYWRKHRVLNKWMMDLAEKKGCDNAKIEEFCIYCVQLEPQDVDALESEIKSKRLYAEAGKPLAYINFDMLCDIDFIRQARIAFSSGLYVFYQADW